MTQVMVSSPEPEATEEGLRILGSGGNVIHAAIGAALFQTAVDPFMCGIAGFGSMHIHLPERSDESHSLQPRQSAGQDVDAGCGQLRGRVKCPWSSRALQAGRNARHYPRKTLAVAPPRNAQSCAQPTSPTGRSS